MVIATAVNAPTLVSFDIFKLLRIYIPNEYTNNILNIENVYFSEVALYFFMALNRFFTISF